MRLLPFFIVLLGLGLLPLTGHAQSTPATPLTKSKEPVEITADDAIEWLRDAHLYRARGKAIVKQGGTTIQANTIEASYDPALGEQNIQTVTATNHVTITSNSTSDATQNRVITADKGVYDLTTGQLVLTGGDLKITSPTMIVTAQQSLNYDRNANKASARGNAIVKTPDRTLKAHEIDAWFSDKNDLSKAAARGDVVIQTPQQIVQADSGDYNAVTQQAVMIGNVRLTQGQNHMQGARATVNLQTGVSQLFGSATNVASGTSSGGRVRALFFPGADKSVLPGAATAGLIPLRPDGRMNQKAGDLPPTSREAGIARIN